MNSYSLKLVRGRGTKTDMYHIGLCNVGPKADFLHSAVSIVM